MDLPWDLLIGAVFGVVFVTFGPYLLGFTGTGITAGSIAAKLQSVGATGVSVKGKVLAAAVGAAVARVGYTLWQHVQERGRGQEAQGNDGEKQEENEKEEKKCKVLAAAVGAAVARVGNTLWQHVQERLRGQEAQGNDGEKQEENEKEEKKGKQEKKYSSRPTFERGRMRGDKLKQC